MARLVKKAVVLFKQETTPGTDATPTGALNAIQVADLEITPIEAQNIDLNYIRAFFGNSESLVGPSFVRIKFTVYLQGSGTAGTAAAWGPLLTCAAFGETTGLTAPTRVEYMPITDLLKTGTAYYHDDGVLHKLLGAFGKVSYSGKVGEAQKFMFEFLGLDGGVTAVANATPVYTAWKTPTAVTKANVVDVTLGCTYATGALSGGTAYNSTGLTLDWGNEVDFAAMLSSEEIVLSDRKLTGSVTMELTAAQEVTMMAAVKANTLQSMGFTVGTTAGFKNLWHLPAVQLTTPKKDEIKGKRVLTFGLRALPVSGNDESRLVLL